MQICIHISFLKQLSQVWKIYEQEPIEINYLYLYYYPSFIFIFGLINTSQTKYIFNIRVYLYIIYSHNYYIMHIIYIWRARLVKPKTKDVCSTPYIPWYIYILYNTHIHTLLFLIKTHCRLHAGVRYKRA